MTRHSASQLEEPWVMRRAVRIFALDVAPLMVLAGTGLALLRGKPPAKPAEALGAKSPADIPVAVWKDIVLRTGREFSDDQIPMIAAGITFYILLALFPGLGAFVALYGLFADVAEVQKHLHTLSFLLPPSAVGLIGDAMLRLAQAKHGGLSFAFVVSLLVSIWSANGAVKAMITGLNIAYEVHERRSFLRQITLSLIFTLGLLAFGFGAVVVLAAPAAIATFAGPSAATLFGWISWPLLLVGQLLGLALLYNYGPHRPPVRWRWITWGSVTALVLWVAVSLGFQLYVGNFGHYDRTYGPLGAVVGAMTWVWLSSMVVLLGGELNSEIERQTAGRPAPGATRPRSGQTIT